jgi:radical SAM protein with 4Fe4S-binding SPASM domain
MCTFCPQDKLQKAYQDPIRKLTVENFKLVLDKLPVDVEIIFAGYTEPWANKHCNEFVRMSLEKGHNIQIYTTLYGILVEQCYELVAILKKHPQQLKQFWIHLPDSKGNMLGWRHSSEYDHVLQIIKSGINCHEMTMDEHAQVSSEITVATNPVNWYLHTRADNLDISKIQSQPVHISPKYEFVVECTRNKNLHSNVLLPNGDIVLCCMDYSLKHILGNLFKDSYQDILNSKELARVRELNNQLKFSDKVLCRSCQDGYCKTPWNDFEVYERVKSINPEILGL